MNIKQPTYWHMFLDSIENIQTQYSNGIAKYFCKWVQLLKHFNITQKPIAYSYNYSRVNMLFSKTGRFVMQFNRTISFVRLLLKNKKCHIISFYESSAFKYNLNLPKAFKYAWIHFVNCSTWIFYFGG